VQTGATVWFARASSGQWGINIASGAAPRISQPKPVKLEVFRAEDDILQLASGHKTAQTSAAGIDASMERHPIFPDDARREASGPTIAMNILSGRACLPV